MRLLALAGPRTETSVIEYLQAFCRDSAHRLELMRSPAPHDAAEALKSLPDVAVILGGDGTLNRYLEHLVEVRVPLLALPAGSGNDFAHCNGIDGPQDAVAAIRKFEREGNATATDLGLARFANGTKRYFSCCLNVGLDADAARRANSLPNWLKSRKGYFLAGAGAIFGYRPASIAVSGEGFPAMDEPAWFVSVSNTPEFGGGLKIAPGASLTDGKLDVTYVSCNRLSRAGLLWHLPKILNGSHTSVKAVRHFAVESINIRTVNPQPVYGDGEGLGQTPVEVECAPGALNVVR
jgi:diacylglycerol kinase (ATP)